MASLSKFPSPLTRLMWTAVFGVPGGILLWLALQETNVSPYMLTLTIGGFLLLALAAYALVATLLALLEVALPDVQEAVDRPFDAPTLPPKKQGKMLAPFMLAVGSLTSYAMALRLYLDPSTVRPNSLRNPLLVVLRPIYDRFGSPGVLIFYLALGSLCLLALVWTWRRIRRR